MALNYGSGRIGITSHISAEMFKTATGVDIVHVPYKGTIQAVTDLVAGQVDMVFADMVPAMPQIRAGKLRPLAVTTDTRSPVLPDVPTMMRSRRAGLRIPACGGRSWRRAERRPRSSTASAQHWQKS